MLRQGIDEPERRARFAAIYAIIGFASVPITFLSIRIWRTIHPVIVESGEGMKMTPDMQTAFFFALFTFTVFGVTLLWHRIRIGNLAAKIEELKMKLYE
jgi:heme exporter protein C